MPGIHQAARAAGISDEQARSLFASILTQAGQGDRVYIKDFGTFSVRVAPARTIRSPQIPGGVAEVPERNVLKFQVSPAAKKLLNGGAEEVEAEATTATDPEVEQDAEEAPAEPTPPPAKAPKPAKAAPAAKKQPTAKKA